MHPPGARIIEYRALKESAGVIELARGKLAVRGADAVDYLHRMLSNDVKSLRPGEGVVSFLLNAQGHILAEMNVLLQSDRLLLDCEQFIAPRLLTELDKFIFMDQVELEDLTPRFMTLAVEGPRCDEVVRDSLGFEPPADKPMAHVNPGGDPDFLMVRATLTGHGIWIVGAPERIVRLRANLDALTVDFEMLEAARVEAGIPRFGADIQEHNIPHETGRLDAISFTKGCYPGQEIVERVRTRGQVNRQLVRLEVDEPVEANAKLMHGDREVGYLTSVVTLPDSGRVVALGYLRREYTQPDQRLDCDGVGARFIAPAGTRRY